MVARGWSPAKRTRIGFYLVVGLSLVLNPLLVGAFDLGGPRHQYRSYEVSVVSFGDRVRVAAGESHGVITVSGVRGVGCDEFTITPSWRCTFEEHVAEAGSLTVETTKYEGPNDPFVHLQDGYFRRTFTEKNDTTTISLEPVDARTVIETVGDDLDETPAPLARAVRHGSARSTLEYETGRYVVDGDQYYYVSRDGQYDGLPGRWGLSALGALIGLALLARGHRLRIERHTRD
ncbi:hypothetical protein [Halorientalis pallida]|uniref:Uncharacterized protein n=1 Tax=Halorientalis pallida TaxID=2479928 RepID=A0A498KW25_9EURY|nr:hypothetical protein [Halorientalis pallida]RXK49417.1 hypothetical protein EAF64_10925 [Halorientalis pallida]